MKKTTRLLALLLAIVLLTLSLAGCSKKQSGSDDGEEEKPDFVYVANYYPIDGAQKIDYVNASAYYNGRIYITAQVVADSAGDDTAEYDVYENRLFSVNEDGTDFKTLENYEPIKIPDGYEGYTGINYMTVDGEGNIWVMESLSTYTFELPAGFDESSDDAWNYYVAGEDTFYLRKLDSTGVELLSIDKSSLKSPNADYFDIHQMNVDGDGNLYLVSDNTIIVLDGDGSELFRMELEGWVNSLLKLQDGRMAAMYYDSGTGSTTKLGVIDVTAKGWGESFDAPSNAYSVYPGAGEYDFYYNSDTSLYGYKLQSGESTKLLNWINCDVNSDNLSCITPLEDGRVLAIYRDWETNDGTQLLTMTKTDASEVKQKTTLTYACMYLDWNVRRQILKFNKSNENYRIETKDYSEYNTEDDYSAGLTKLTTEILTGNVPDMFATNQMPLSQMASRGILEDVWPYIDADTELGGRDALMTQVLSAFEQDGKLYEVVSSFYINTVIGATSVVGEEMGWTLDELYAALKTLPEGADVFSWSVDKEDVLSYCCYMMLDDFVDWDTGKCSFDSEEFKDILRFTDLFQRDFDWENYDYDNDYESDYSRLRSGKQLLCYATVSDFPSFQMYKAMFGGGATFKGFPTGKGNGSAFGDDGTGIAMSSSCRDKAGAWEFVRTFLTEEYQKNNVWSFPTNKAAFEQKLKDAMTPEYTTDSETGEQVEVSKGTWGWDELEVEIYAMTQDEVDRIMDLINTTTNVYYFDTKLYNIISEEATAYFDGKRGVDDTAKSIQSRVSLYVNEQK